MNNVKIAILKNSLSRYLALVRDGAEVVVLDRETPIARIVPFRPQKRGGAKAAVKDDYWTEARLAGLEGRGTLRRGRDGSVGSWLGSRKAARLPKAASAVETLLRMRRESTR